MSVAAVRNVSQASLYDSAKLHVGIRNKFLASIPYIGGVQVTSSWRPPSGAGKAGSLHKKVPSLALDFIPEDPDLWSVFNKLRALGWQRIGLRPDKHAIHLDIGVETGLSRPYLFFEGVGGTDLGPLSSQPASNLNKIPGYSSSNVREFPTPTKKKTSWLLPGLVLLGLGGYAAYKIIE